MQKIIGFFKTHCSLFGLLLVSVGFVAGAAADGLAGGQGGGCDADEACGEGQLCVRGRCQNIQCKTNKECGEGRVCIDLQCVQARCDSDKACDPGARCASGRCWWPVATRSPVDRREMVVVPGGNFAMGSGSADAVSDELPVHVVEVESFFIDRFEVTAGEYQACIDAGICKADWVKTVAEWDECTLGDPVRKDLPVNCVNWEGADAYCRWVGKRLPSEAEWERAAGGGDPRLFVWGDALPSCDRACTNRNGAPGCGTGLVCLPGSHPPDMSVYGVFDMAGNLQEWTSDWYDRGYYVRSPRIRPVGGVEASGQRCVRGGSYHDLTERLRVQSRDRLEPQNRSVRIGFRCVSP